jgi:hypothetical protein
MKIVILLNFSSVIKYKNERTDNLGHEFLICSLNANAERDILDIDST